MKQTATIRNRQLRKSRIKARVKGTSDKPRLVVSISNRHISAQIIDDTINHTVAACSTIGQKNLPKNLSERAEWIGREIAKKAAKVKVVKVVFDRSGKKYHGRIAALADTARKSGLEF